jgi:hypothetical protein
VKIFYLYFKDSFRYEIMKFGQNGPHHVVPEVSNYTKGHLGNPFGCTQKSAGMDEVGL